MPTDIDVVCVDTREDRKQSLSVDADKWTQKFDEERTGGHGVKDVRRVKVVG